MNTGKRRKIQRVSRRFEAPCSESYSQRKTDAGDQPLINRYYSGPILAAGSFRLHDLPGLSSIYSPWLQGRRTSGLRQVFSAEHMNSEHNLPASDAVGRLAAHDILQIK